MTDEQQQVEKPKRVYKPRTPDLELVVKSIDAGEYDLELFKIRDALQRRLDQKQEQVMALVREAFGEEAEILLRKTRVEDATDNPPMPGVEYDGLPIPSVALERLALISQSPSRKSEIPFWRNCASRLQRMPLMLWNSTLWQIAILSLRRSPTRSSQAPTRKVQETEIRIAGMTAWRRPMEL